MCIIRHYLFDYVIGIDGVWDEHIFKSWAFLALIVMFTRFKSLCFMRWTLLKIDSFFCTSMLTVITRENELLHPSCSKGYTLGVESHDRELNQIIVYALCVWKLRNWWTIIPYILFKNRCQFDEPSSNYQGAIVE